MNYTRSGYPRNLGLDGKAIKIGDVTLLTRRLKRDALYRQLVEAIEVALRTQ